MKIGQIILLGLISIFGVLIAFLTYGYLKDEKTNIYLFNADYEAGRTITPDMLEIMEVDNKLVHKVIESNSPAQYVLPSDLQKIIDNKETLGCDVSKYTPFMSTQTASVGGSLVERRLAKNKVAITIPVNNISGVSPEITAGAMINVYTNYSSESFQVEELLMEEIKILDVQATGDAESGYSLSGITIQVSPEQTLKLLHAINFQKIDVVLLKTGHYEQVDKSKMMYKVNTEMMDMNLSQQK